MREHEEIELLYVLRGTVMVTPAAHAPDIAFATPGRITNWTSAAPRKMMTNGTYGSADIHQPTICVWGGAGGGVGG